MNDKSPRKTGSEPPDFASRVDSKARLRLKAQRKPEQTIWFGLGMIGLVGWSVAIPTLLGAALGVWLDRNYPGSHSWTLMFLAIGLAIGCMNAWHWVDREEKDIHKEEDSHE